MTKADEIKKKLTPGARTPKPPAEYLSTDCTLLNLGLSGKWDGGFALGTYNLFVGDSQSGKTIMAYNTLNAAANNPAFDGYDLIYDNPEMREFFDIQKLWGQKLAIRIQPPSRDKTGRAIYSKRIEDFYFSMDDRKKKGKPFIWVEDSMASLSSVAEQDKFQENKAAHRKGQDMVGSYGDGKAKVNSAMLRQFMDYLEETKSLLIIINQTRDNIGFAATFNPKTWSGGHALKFYAAHELWSSLVGAIKKKVGIEELKIGNKCKITIKKNSVTGKERSVVVPVYDGTGVDDLGSCVDYLVERKHWGTGEESDVDAGDGKKRKKAGPIQATELGLTGYQEKLIELIQDDNMEDDLRKIVQDVWTAIEAQCVVHRKPRYPS